METRYLNNDGSRWVILPRNRHHRFVLESSGERKLRRADFFESFGNFAAYYFRVAGKRYSGLPKTFPVKWEGEELPLIVLEDCATK